VKAFKFTFKSIGFIGRLLNHMRGNDGEQLRGKLENVLPPRRTGNFRCRCTGSGTQGLEQPSLQLGPELVGDVVVVQLQGRHVVARKRNVRQKVGREKVQRISSTLLSEWEGFDWGRRRRQSWAVRKTDRWIVEIGKDRILSNSFRTNKTVQPGWKLRQIRRRGGGVFGLVHGVVVLQGEVSMSLFQIRTFFFFGSEELWSHRSRWQIVWEAEKVERLHWPKQKS